MIKRFSIDKDGNNPHNFVESEALKNVVAQEARTLEHNIFFGDTLILYYLDTQNPDIKYPLKLGVDYQLTDRDETASSYANHICYRSFITFSDYPVLYASYHVYADLLKAENYNELLDFINDLNTDRIPEGKKNRYYHPKHLESHPMILGLGRRVEEFRVKEVQLKQEWDLLVKTYRIEHQNLVNQIHMLQAKDSK